MGSVVWCNCGRLQIGQFRIYCCQQFLQLPRHRLIDICLCHLKWIERRPRRQAPASTLIGAAAVRYIAFPALHAALFLRCRFPWIVGIDPVLVSAVVQSRIGLLSAAIVFNPLFFVGHGRMKEEAGREGQAGDGVFHFLLEPLVHIAIVGRAILVRGELCALSHIHAVSSLRPRCLMKEDAGRLEGKPEAK